jgi:hypothetical protein
MSIKQTLQNMKDFMSANPSYKPSKLVVKGNADHVLRTLKKHGLSQTLSLNGVPIECSDNKKAATR